MNSYILLRWAAASKRYCNLQIGHFWGVKCLDTEGGGKREKRIK
jgi:hypothetical protein